MSTTRSVTLVMIVVFVAHVAISRLVDLPVAEGRYELLIGVAYFVFGLFAAFAINTARSSLMQVHELLKAGDSDLVSIHELAACFGDERQRHLLGVIDSHLQDQIDYRLADFELSTPSFLGLFSEVRSLSPITTEQQISYDHLLGICVRAAERRTRLGALVRQRISGAQWVTLLSLLASLWGLMLAANGGPIVASVLGGLLVASLAGLMVLLVHLDNLRWQEREAIWQPLHNLFLMLGLVPYYPRAVLTSRRVDPPSGPLRLADYPNRYPDMAGKEVEVVTDDERPR